MRVYSFFFFTYVYGKIPRSEVLGSIVMIYIDESLFKGSVSTHMTKMALMFNMI